MEEPLLLLNRQRGGSGYNKNFPHSFSHFYISPNRLDKHNKPIPCNNNLPFPHKIDILFSLFSFFFLPYFQNRGGQVTSPAPCLNSDSANPRTLLGVIGVIKQLSTFIAIYSRQSRNYPAKKAKHDIAIPTLSSHFVLLLIQSKFLSTFPLSLPLH